MQHPTRRHFLAGGLATLSATAGASLVSVVAGAEKQPTLIEPRVTEHGFFDDKVTRGVLAYTAEGPAPTLRLRQGDELRVRLLNRLKEPTTLHWHGVRVPNAMDGVPFLTQPFVYENETFDYAFSPPDAGTYWYHPHCNSLQQMSFGLSGLLVVEERKNPGFDADLALSLRDWRLGENGQFLKLYNPRQTARAGTHGTLRTVDWRREPTYEAPAGGLARVRLVVVDVTRIYKLAVDGAPALIVALDGNPLPAPMPLETYPVAPGQRMDIVVRMPDREGETVAIIDHSTAPAAPLARLQSVGASRRRDLRDVTPLPRNPFREPDLSAAIPLSFEFQATAEQLPKSKYCGDLGYSFWAINRRVWTGSAPDPGAPMAELKLGRTYILNLFNRTPHPHPIHLHGMSFKLLKSDRRTLPEAWTDTALIVPDEHVQVALVADNPGDWLLHCHIIEHQETGMTGFVRVS